MVQVQPWVKELTEEVLGGSPLKIGQRVPHESGVTVEIVSGEYWGTSGLSNFWEWREVNPEGSLGRKGCGYGYVNEQGILEGGEWERRKKK